MDGVFFSGWRGHDELPLGLSCADVFVAPSVGEPFGLVFLEAMSCSAVPVITTTTGGPLSFVNTVAGRPNGWLVPPDDVDALADALVEAINDDATRNERADNATQQIRDADTRRAPRTLRWPLHQSARPHVSLNHRDRRPGPVVRGLSRTFAHGDVVMPRGHSC